MRDGSMPMRKWCATRCTSVVVLPVPAPATISSGVSPCSTATRCSSFRTAAGELGDLETDLGTDRGLLCCIRIQLVLEDLFELLHFGTYNRHAVTRARIVLIIILVVILSSIKRRQRAYLSHNLCGEGARFIEFRFVGFSSFLLIFIVVEDHRSILSTFVGTLLVKRSGVVGLPEDFQKFVERYFGWVVVNLANFGVAGRSCTDLLVSWIGVFAACVTGDNIG